MEEIVRLTPKLKWDDFTLDSIDLTKGEEYLQLGDDGEDRVVVMNDSGYEISFHKSFFEIIH